MSSVNEVTHNIVDLYLNDYRSALNDPVYW